jgi:hypothetical protein
MASKFSDYEVIKYGGQGMQSSALTPDQRKLAAYAREHPGTTLSEARQETGITELRLTKAEREDMAAHTPWEDLSPARKRLMAKVPDEHVTAKQIANYTRLPESLIEKRIGQYRGFGLDRSSLVYKASRGFYAKSNVTGVTVVLHGRSDQNEGLVKFAMPKDIEKTIRDKKPCVSPDPDGNCPEERTVKVWIPLKDGAERSNLSGTSGEIEAA